MLNIPFQKYTSCGNNFILIDERESHFIPEIHKSDFAKQVTDPCFGIGADGCILIQPCTRFTLADINTHRHYWRQPPADDHADYLFRMFEPNGTESFCCGNGLLCIAHHLQLSTTETVFSVLTEIPGPLPVVRPVGFDQKKQTAWTDMGTPRAIPWNLAKLDPVTRLDSNIYRVEFQIPLDQLPWSDSLSLSQGNLPLTGYLIFSGEPHLVFIFETHEDENASSTTGSLYRQSLNIMNKTGTPTHNDLLCDPFHALGHYFNAQKKKWFPSGINVNFIKWHPSTQTMSHRCFERGIEKETLACGTGIVASAHLLCALNYATADSIEVHPLKCRTHRPGATMWITVDKGRYRLEGSPRNICTGIFNLTDILNECHSAPHPTNMVVEL